MGGPARQRNCLDPHGKRKDIMLNYTKTENNGAVTIALKGRLDTDTAPGFEAALMEALPEIAELTLDMGELSYISSAGLRVLLRLQKRQPEHLKVTRVKDSIMDIFEATGFDEILTVEQDPENA